MEDGIVFPTASAILKPDPIFTPTSTSTVKKPVKPRNNASSKAAVKSTIGTNGTNDGAITKPKQSKSRNGCMTCKRKRLKCDETHPHCQQCAKRNVQCEGYKKDFKWRQFEETSFVQGFKPVPKSRKTTTSISSNTHQPQPRHVPINGDHQTAAPSRLSPSLDSAFASARHAIQGSPSPDSHRKRASPPQSSPSTHNLPQLFDPTNEYNDGLDPYSVPETASGSNDEGSGRSADSTMSSGSPHPLHDLLLPNTDLNSPPDASEQRPPMSPHPYQPASLDSPTFDIELPLGEEFDEEVIRQPPDLPELEGEIQPWMFRQSSPVPSEASTTSSKSSGLTLLAQPKFNDASPEMLSMRFDRETCGILSIKDGPSENPWRNLIWPLARDSPALYHAINSMVAFHGSHDMPPLRVEGMAQFTQSIKKLSQEIANMRTDAGLATALALAFSEGWDHHTTTGIQHLRGARSMVTNAVFKQCQDVQLGSLDTQDAMRLKFLCNTYVYMDVIARLTSLEKAHDFDLTELVSTVNPVTHEPAEVDPLMGCAVDLFPLISKVANLIQRVRQTTSNSFQIISEASHLKEELHEWQPMTWMSYEKPEDLTSHVQHSIQTAEAYRYATLLYLHQAVPETPSETSGELAGKVLMNLASVPVSSRVIIVQIFPLLAAGCEVTSEENRDWVMQRWDSMCKRLRIGNVLRCVDIVQEVWRRRDEHDAYVAEKQEQLIRRYTARGMPRGDFIPPMLSPGKRKAQTSEGGTESSFFGADGFDDSMRPMKRRVTLDAMDMAMPTMNSMPLQSPNLGGRIGDLTIDRSGPEYTVRGRLHWLGVMRDQNWEVFLG